MVEEEKPRKVIVDTYVLLAMAFGELGEKASQLLQDVRRGRIVGLLPVTVAYEYIVHWRRGRIPVLTSLEEVVTFLTRYFRVENLDLIDWVKAAEIKHKGDSLLRDAEDPGLKRRRLSIVDSTVIVLAQKHRAPIATGDRDLAYVASKLGITIAW
ncbi:type II toxin-antitoxin system VapC family toxin [Pyrodictium delaneyi]|nr:PIN domain-containing protein [Pyrodictium delaneyi]